MAKNQQLKIIFGLKLRQLRQERGWNFDELAKRTGISPSYLNEIEKGKKSPQSENLGKLAEAFGVEVAHLTSPDLGKQFAPLADLLHSNFLTELPLETFGIDLQQVVEIVARAPERVNAFISAMLEIARNYSVREETFYHAALRAYQELHMNYFEEIEVAAEQFAEKHGLPTNGAVATDDLFRLLKSEFGYRIEEKGLAKIPELRGLRSVFIPKRKRLLLNGMLGERQRAFQLGKEIGFQVLGLEERPLASTMLRVNSFEEMLNNFKAAYFSVALLVNRHAFLADLRHLFGQSTWQPAILLGMMNKYQASPEVLFQRFNILQKEFDMHRIFFLRFIHDLDRDGFDLDKELFLNRRHQPHASGLNEHYCRRWLPITLLRNLQAQQQSGQPSRQLPIGIHRAQYFDTGEEYLVCALAKAGHPTPNRNVGIALGLQIDEVTRRHIKFLDDPAIPREVVNFTCQRCSIEPCDVRVAPPIFLTRREEKRKMQEALMRLTGRLA